MVYADMLMIQIVVRNLLNNAIKFCYPNSTIQIESVYSGNMVRLTIRDNGIGMPPEICSRIFRGENLSHRGTLNEKGTGIGLMVCKDFIERNEGTIEVESAEGKGTAVYIYLQPDLTN